MPSGLLIRLRPTSPWRIGPDSGDRDRVDRIFHSDSLYSAVCGAMLQLGELDAWLEATARAAEPAVRLSSCFPYQGEMRLITPPRTLWPPPASAKVRWKGAKFVPLPVISALLEGKPVSEDAWIVDGPSECLIPQNASSPFRVAVRTAAGIDREGSAVAPHSCACLEFAPDAGFWTVAAFASEDARNQWQDRLKGAFRLLGDSGFGGERSRGWGRADISFSDDGLDLLPPAGESQESGWWILSLYHPASEDPVDWARGNYALSTRGGRLESSAGWGEPKRATRMVSEGSVLVSTSEPRGSVTDVAPEGFAHPVYRAGFALAYRIPLKADVVRQAAS